MMIEVKLSDEEAKYGCAPAGSAPQLIETVRACPNLRLAGLMTMPPWTDDAEQSRPYFRQLRELAAEHGLAQPVDGDVARFRDRHRRRRDAHPRRYGAVRQAQEGGRDADVGFYSPLPPARTGVADYSAALVLALRARVEVETNPASPRGVPLYHMGNNRLHAAIYRRALDHPGVVVLHDAVLHHFFLGALEEQAYVEEFTYNYGAWHRELALRLWRERGGRRRMSAIFPTQCCGVWSSGRAG